MPRQASHYMPIFHEPCDADRLAKRVVHGLSSGFAGVVRGLVVQDQTGWRLALSRLIVAATLPTEWSQKQRVEDGDVAVWSTPLTPQGVTALELPALLHGVAEFGCAPVIKIENTTANLRADRTSVLHGPYWDLSYSDRSAGVRVPDRGIAIGTRAFRRFQATAEWWLEEERLESRGHHIPSFLVTVEEPSPSISDVVFDAGKRTATVFVNARGAELRDLRLIRHYAEGAGRESEPIPLSAEKTDLPLEPGAEDFSIELHHRSALKDAFHENAIKSSFVPPRLSAAFISPTPDGPSARKLSARDRTSAFAARFGLVAAEHAALLDASPWIPLFSLGRGGGGAVYLAAHESLADTLVTIANSAREGAAPADAAQMTAALRSGARRAMWGEALAAVKIPLRLDEKDAKRFAFEIEAVRHTRSNHVIRLLDADTDVPPRWVAMAFHPRGCLEDSAERYLNAPLEVLQRVRPVAAALIPFHEKGIRHRDIKAANILIGDDEAWVLTDFGIALPPPDVTRLTTHGKAVQSPSWVPEWVRGKIDAEYTPAEDAYMLMNAAHYAVTGAAVVASRGPEEFAVLRERWRDIEAGQELVDLFEKILVPRQSEMVPKSAADLLVLIEDILGHYQADARSGPLDRSWWAFSSPVVRSELRQAAVSHLRIKRQPSSPQDAELLLSGVTRRPFFLSRAERLCVAAAQTSSARKRHLLFKLLLTEPPAVLSQGRLERAERAFADLDVSHMELLRKMLDRGYGHHGAFVQLGGKEFITARGKNYGENFIASETEVLATRADFEGLLAAGLLVVTADQKTQGLQGREVHFWLAQTGEDVGHLVAELDVLREVAVPSHGSQQGGPFG